MGLIKGLMMIEKKYTTTLETLAHDVGSILDHKLSATSSQAVADYVAFGVSNLEENIIRAKQAKKELDAYIKEQTSAIETVKEGTSKWLTDNGIDKLEGMRISSLTTYTPKETKKIKVLNEQFFFDIGYYIETKVVDMDKVKAWIEDMADKHGLESLIETYGENFTIETTHKQPVIKINKRKA